MNRFFNLSLLLLVTALFMGGCDDKKDDPSGTDTIHVQNSSTLSQTVFADEVEGKSPVKFTTVGAWNAIVNSGIEWLSITPESGDAAGSYTANISLLVNATGAERSGEITIMCEGESITIKVKQKATKRDGTAGKPNVDVYVAGYEYEESGHVVAKLWKNGVVQKLSDKRSKAYSVYVSGSDVYVAGTEDRVATLWKNGVPQYLPSDEVSSLYSVEAYSVFVSNNDVYVAGYETSPQGNRSVAKLWKNGTAQNLSNGPFFAEAKSVYVSGNDVYVAGFEDKANYDDVAKLWKNGVEQGITDGTLVSEFNSVFVSGNDVYVAGMEDHTSSNYFSIAKLWKNGVAQNLTDGSDAAEIYSVFVSGNDVYVAGAVEPIFTYIPTIWKNGVAQQLPGVLYSARATSVFVLDNNVYVAGYETESYTSRSTIKVWINGELQEITDKKGEAYSIFVVEK